MKEGKIKRKEARKREVGKEEHRQGRKDREKEENRGKEGRREGSKK